MAVRVQERRHLDSLRITDDFDQMDLVTSRCLTLGSPLASNFHAYISRDCRSLGSSLTFHRLRMKYYVWLCSKCVFLAHRATFCPKGIPFVIHSSSNSQSLSSNAASSVPYFETRSPTRLLFLLPAFCPGPVPASSIQPSSVKISARFPSDRPRTNRLSRVNCVSSKTQSSVPCKLMIDVASLCSRICSPVSPDPHVSKGKGREIGAVWL